MLGSAPPRTIKVRPEGEATDDHVDSSDDYSSCDTSSGESENMSSSDRDSDSSDGVDEDEDVVDRTSVAQGDAASGAYMAYMGRPSKRQCRRRTSHHSTTHPFSPYLLSVEAAAQAPRKARQRVMIRQLRPLSLVPARKGKRGEEAREI